MKLNESKCHFLISGHKFETVWAKVGQCMIWEERTIFWMEEHKRSLVKFRRLCGQTVVVNPWIF